MFIYYNDFSGGEGDASDALLTVDNSSITVDDSSITADQTTLKNEEN